MTDRQQMSQESPSGGTGSIVESDPPVVSDGTLLGEALKELERKHAILDQTERLANVGSWEYNVTHDRLTMSNNLRAIFGFDGGDQTVPLAALWSRIHPLDRNQARTFAELRISNKQGFWQEYRIADQGQGVREVSVRAEYIRDTDRGSDYMIGAVQDITLQRSLEREVLDTADREQMRLGRELHDTVGQELVGLALIATSLERALSNDKATASQQARQVREIAQRCVERCRLITQGLIPIDVSGEYISARLQALCEGMQDLYGIPCECTVPDDVTSLDTVTATNIYHIAREAVVNAMRHASASCVRIVLDVNDDGGTITVADDGTWKAPLTCGGVGLRIMHHRATLINAELRVRHSVGTGTTVTCRLPTSCGHESHPAGFSRGKQPSPPLPSQAACSPEE